MKPSEFEKELKELWEKRSYRQEIKNGDCIVDFDNLLIDVRKLVKKKFIDRAEYDKLKKESQTNEVLMKQLKGKIILIAEVEKAIKESKDHADLIIKLQKLKEKT